jgi:hypothetical protein
VVEEHDARIPDLGGAYDRIACPILMVLEVVMNLLRIACECGKRETYGGPS